MRMRIWPAFLFVVLGAVAFAEDPKPATFPESAGPFMGDWQGVWVQGEEKHPNIAAQVIALGNEAYQVVLVEQLYARTPPYATVDGREEDGKLVFDNGEYYGEIADGIFTGGRRGDDEASFRLEPYTLTSPTLGAKPPEGAIVLFDGSNLDEWRGTSRRRFWSILDNGVLQANPELSYIVSDREFTDFDLHLEFREPFLPEMRGQERGNSGVYLQGIYEVQVLDSYGLPGYWNECGALYRMEAPYVNMCAPPLQWQTYDIEFRAARFNADGEVTAKPRLTVRHNGVFVHKDTEISRGTSGDAIKGYPSLKKGPDRIRLQAHNNHVQFRNIWVVDRAKAQ